eukprot:GDKI01031284.1.p1 GENE.GDKI01031284.1~~GDKI01031284.1.p1  ORF type:complete len:165 (-),score=31.70 GDKI01031284.1:173-667(-)
MPAETQGGKFFGEDVFNPKFVMNQMVAIQACFYFLFVLIGSLLDNVFGYPVSLFQFFDSQSYGWASGKKLVVTAAFLLSSIVMSHTIAFVVERARKCLDFVSTYHFLHLIFCWVASGFPSGSAFWVSAFVSTAVATLYSEWLCMQTEMKDIKLKPPAETEMAVV